MSTRRWFIQVPGAFFEDGHLVAIGSGLAVYLHLLARQDRESRTVKTRIQSIADAVGKSDKTVRDWLKDLTRAGYIDVVRKQHHLQIFILDLPDISDSRSVENYRSETGSDRQKTTGLNNPDRQFLNVRSVENYRSPNMKFVPDSCSRLKEGEGDSKSHTNTQPTTPTPVDNFLRFSLNSHRVVHGVDLILSPGDAGRVRDYFAAVGGRWEPASAKRRKDYALLCIAWGLYQRDTSRPYLRNRARTVVLFFKPATLNDYLVPAKTRMDAIAGRRMASGRAPDSPAELLDGQDIQPPEIATRYWARCRDFLESKILEENFYTWFSPLFAVAITDKEFVLAVPNKFYEKCIRENYLDLVYAGLATVDGVKRKIKFQFSAGAAATGRAQLKTKKARV